MDNQKELDGMNTSFTSRYNKTYSEAEMLDAFYAGKQFGINSLANNLKIGEESENLSFDQWITQYKNEKHLAKELKDDEMRAEAQADGEQYERELDEANQL